MNQTRAQRIAAIEEQFDTVPEPQFQSERKLRAATAKISRYEALLRELAQTPIANDVYSARDQFGDMRAKIKAALAVEGTAAK